MMSVHTTTACCHGNGVLTISDVWVSLSYGDDTGQHGTEPLGVEEVEVTQPALIKMEEDT